MLIEQLLSMITQTEVFPGIFCLNCSSKGGCILNRFARYFKVVNILKCLMCLITLFSVHFGTVIFPMLYFQLLGNFLQWYGILSNKTLQELSIDGLLNRYILMAFQNSEYGEDSIKKAQSVSKIKQCLK